MKRLFVSFLLFSCFFVHAQQEIPLYGKGPIPNSRPLPGYTNSPTLTVFLPQVENPKKTGVIICPGGAYVMLSMMGEGIEVARWLNSLGIAAFVLKYRLPNDQTMIDKTIGPLQDAQRAIQLVREHAGEWGLDSTHIGMLGFSAGGHLASTAGTHFLKTTIENYEHISLRPDFMILAYPVISFADSICHRETRDHLLGTHPDSAAILDYSNERQVTKYTPPAFIVHAEDDDGVPALNSLYFYEALVKNEVPAELIIYPKGRHAFGLKNSGAGGDEWTDRLKSWLRSNGWL